MIETTSTNRALATRISRAVSDFVHMFLDARFWLWTFMLVGGFAYVAGCLCGRHNPLASPEGGYGELAKLLISAPLLFFLGPRHNLESCGCRLAPHTDEEWGRLFPLLLCRAALVVVSAHSRMSIIP